MLEYSRSSFCTTSHWWNRSIRAIATRKQIFTIIYGLLYFAFSRLFSAIVILDAVYPWRIGGASALRLQSCVRVFSIRLPFLPRLPRRRQPHSLARRCRPHSLQLWAITRSGCEHESTSNCSATAHLLHEV